MKFWLKAFNLYLLGVAVCLLSGCATDADAKKDKQPVVMRFHAQVPPGQLSGQNGFEKFAEVSIFRASPVILTVQKQPVLDETQIDDVEMVDELGTYSIRVHFNRQGTWLLENITTANRNSRLAVFTAFPEQRWLAAPYLDHTIRDGVLVFTPDASREETEKIVLGLKKTIEKLKKDNAFFKDQPQ